MHDAAVLGEYASCDVVGMMHGLGHGKNGRDAGVRAAEHLLPVRAGSAGEATRECAPHLRPRLPIVLVEGVRGDFQSLQQFPEELRLKRPNGDEAVAFAAVATVKGRSAVKEV